MIVSRFQHTLAAFIIFVVSVWVAWVSFSQQPAEAFLFPRLIAIFFVGLSAWNLIRASTGMAKVGVGMDPTTLRNIASGIVVALVYVFFAAKFLGFYFSSTITFLLIFTLYDPTPFSDIKGWVKRMGVTVCFMVVMYGLFALLLKVQTPKGIWF